MANKTDTLYIRVNPNLKKKAENTLNRLGMNITEAVTIYLNQIILTESIPFKIEIPKPNKETISAIEDSENGVGLSKGYTDLNEMWNDLEKE